jgi:hypothetical protein
MVDRITNKKVNIHIPLKLENIHIRNTSFAMFPYDVSVKLLIGKYGDNWRFPPSNSKVDVKKGIEAWKQELINSYNRPQSQTNRVPN